MFTPQQIQEISFDTVRKGGYDMDSVDRVLEPLTQDYLTLYKENSVLKSKLRILVEKLEEYRQQESSMQNAILTAQKTSEKMIAEAENKSAKILLEAEQKAQSKAQNIDSLTEAEAERLNAAKKASADFIDSMEKRLKRQIELLNELRKLELSEAAKEQPKERRAYDFNTDPAEPTKEQKADALIEQIGLNIEEKMSDTFGHTGGMSIRTEAYNAEERKPAPLHGDFANTTPKKFEDLQFGRNYHPDET